METLLIVQKEPITNLRIEDFECLSDVGVVGIHKGSVYYVNYYFTESLGIVAEDYLHIGYAHRYLYLVFLRLKLLKMQGFIVLLILSFKHYDFYNYYGAYLFFNPFYQYLCLPNEIQYQQYKIKPFN